MPKTICAARLDYPRDRARGDNFAPIEQLLEDLGRPRAVGGLRHSGYLAGFQK